MLDRDTVIITGGHPLRGAVVPQGGKGVALLLYAAMLLPDGDVRLTRVPAILDTDVAIAIARAAGYRADRNGTTLHVTRTGPDGPARIPDEVGRRARFTVSAAAALLARVGQVTFPLPGGDDFCPRPVDLHVAAMRAAGAEVEEHGRRITARLPATGPRPFTVSARSAYGPSVGATATALLLAARATGTSLITGPSRDPDVRHLVRFLRACGVGVGRRGDGALEVTGTAAPTGTTFRLPPDRIEAGTYAIAAALTGGDVLLRDTTYDLLGRPVAAMLRRAGARLSPVPGGLRVTAAGPGRPQRITTAPQPGYPTDLQPQATVLLTRAPGLTTVTEAVFPARVSHITGLRRFGARIHAVGRTTRITGGTRLTAATVTGTDIRCAVAYVLGALAADGTSTVGGLYHVRRGHGDLVGGLRALGADLVPAVEGAAA